MLTIQGILLGLLNVIWERLGSFLAGHDLLGSIVVIIAQFYKTEVQRHLKA